MRLSLRLFVRQAWRLLRRPRVWLAGGVILAIGVANVYWMRDGGQGQLSWWVVLKYALSPVAVLLPLLVAGAVGTLMADDRGSGFVSLVLVRSVRPLSFLLSELGASMVAAAAVVAIPLAMAGYLARAIAPPVGTAISRIPAGFPRSGVLLSLVPAMMFAAAAVFVVAVATLTGVLTTNVLAVVSVPGLLFLVGGSFSPGREAWAPFTNMAIQSGGPTLLGILLFWVVGALVALAASVAILRRRGL